MTARTTDPATSHLAATYINGKRPGLKEAFLMALRALGPSTANEIADWCVRAGIVANAESVRKRAKELINDGLAKYGPSRTCKITKQPAGTLELCHADSPNSIEQPSRSDADGRESLGNSKRDGTTEGHRQTVPSQQDASFANQERRQTVCTPEAERLKAAVEYMQHEREWIDDWRVALELSKHAASGNWPKGSSEDYQQALTAASKAGLIERQGGKVRRKRAEVVEKVAQKGLFDAE